MIIIMDLLCNAFLVEKSQQVVSKLWFENYHDAEMIIRIWGFVVADCVLEIGDMQEKVFLQ